MSAVIIFSAETELGGAPHALQRSALANGV